MDPQVRPPHSGHYTAAKPEGNRLQFGPRVRATLWLALKASSLLRSANGVRCAAGLREVMTVSGTSVLARTRCGRSHASHREMPGGSVERMIPSNRRWPRVFSMALIGSGSPTAPSAVAPISRRRCNSVSRLDFASAMPWSRVRASAALGSRSASTGKAQLSALKSLTRWVVGVAGASTQNLAGPALVRQRSTEQVPQRHAEEERSQRQTHQ